MEVVYIRVVESDGLDIVNNGIVLFGICYWMFDRGFVSFFDEYEILILR